MHLIQMRVKTLVAILLIAIGIGEVMGAPIDKGFTYQGQVKLGGSPLTGTADLQFTLFDAAVAGAQIGTQAVTNVAVDSGLFTVTLNASGEMGAAAFDGNARWIEIAVRSPAGAGAYTTLTPRQALKNAPYASYASYALTAENGGVLTTPPNGTPGVLWTRSPNNTDIFVSNALAGIGFSAPVARLHVRAPSGLPAETSRFEDVFGRSQLRIATPESAGRAELQAWNGQTNAAGPLSLNVAGGSVGIGTASPNASFRLQAAGGTGVWRGAIAATGATNSVVMGELSGIATLGGHNAALTAWANVAINPVGGNVGIGTTNPTSRLDVAGTFETDAFKLNGNGAAAGRVLTCDASGNGTWVAPFQSQWVDSGPDIYFNGGDVGIGTATPAAPLHVATGTDAAPASGGYIVAGATNSFNVAIDNDEIIARNNGALATLYLNGDKVVVPVLQITGGSDVAEPYDVASTGDTQPKPGLVVAIDPDNVGKMRVVARAYDRTVAGIISGANGIKPGLTLTQTGTVADGDLPVASIGRVWCWCDAEAAGPIAVGDMLTTSNTPGHAMRVTDHDRAQGAVLGKAMSSLKSGKGLVLVLVSLQ